MSADPRALQLLERLLVRVDVVSRRLVLEAVPCCEPGGPMCADCAAAGQAALDELYSDPRIVATLDDEPPGPEPERDVHCPMCPPDGHCRTCARLNETYESAVGDDDDHLGDMDPDLMPWEDR